MLCGDSEATCTVKRKNFHFPSTLLNQRDEVSSRPVPSGKNNEHKYGSKVR